MRARSVKKCLQNDRYIWAVYGTFHAHNPHRKYPALFFVYPGRSIVPKGKWKWRGIENSRAYTWDMFCKASGHPNDVYDRIHGPV